MAWPGHDPGSPLRALAGDLGAVRDADVLAARLEATAGRLPEGAREAGARRVLPRLVRRPWRRLRSWT
jgi:CHAD domain-containing protein